MNQAIIRLAKTENTLELLRQLKMGFEFEFHAFEGKEREDLESEELDYDECDTDQLYRDSAEALNEASDSDLLDYLPRIGPNTDSDRADCIRLIKGIVESHMNYWDLKQVCDNLGTGPVVRIFDQIFEHVESSYRESWEQDALENDPSRYYAAMGGEYEIELDRSILELGTDQSVKGGEIRTLGGLTVSQWLRAAKQVLAQDFTVDGGCSFHIHLSVPGVKHSFGKRIQSDCMLYLLDNWARLPEVVRERLSSDKSYKWAKFQISTDKYSAVHWHSQGTLEFRLFGGVSSLKDAIACLLLAAEALRFAYRQILDGTSGQWLERIDRLGIELAECADGIRSGEEALASYVRRIAKRKGLRPAA